MWRRIGRLRPYQLLMTWAAYWLALFGITLGHAAALIYRVSQVAGEHGSVNASFQNTELSLTIVNAGHTVWQGSVGTLVAALWLSIPPLAFWLVWLRASAPERALRAAAGSPSLDAGDVPLRSGLKERQRVKR